MPVLALKRFCSSFSPSAAAAGASAPRSRSLPPLARRHTVAWVRRFGERSLGDVRTTKALNLRARIAVARSLHELWHFREEVFSLVACRHDQARAAGRLAELDLQHFPRRDRS